MNAPIPQKTEQAAQAVDQSMQTVAETVEDAVERTRQTADQAATKAVEMGTQVEQEATHVATDLRDTLDDAAGKVADEVDSISLGALWSRATDEIRDRALAVLGWKLLVDDSTPTAEVKPEAGRWVVDTRDIEDRVFARKRDALDFARAWAKEREGTMIVRNADRKLQKTLHYSR